MNSMTACSFSSTIRQVALAFGTGLCVAFASATAQAADKVTIFSGSDEHWVPLQVAKAKNFFSEEGINADVTAFTTGAAATEAFRAGRGDLISAGDLPSEAMWKSGEAIGIAPMSEDSEIFGIVGKNTIKSPQDLKGKKVATRMGSTGEFLLYRYLAKGGLTPADVSIVDLAPPEMVIAQVQGNIDAFSWLAPFTTRAVASGKDVKLITDSKGLANNRIILSATKSFHEGKPEVLKRVVRALIKATKYTQENPEEATKIWAGAVLGDAKQSLPVVKLIKYDMTVDDAFVQDMNSLSEFMIEKGVLKSALDWRKETDFSVLRAVDPNLVKVPAPK